MPLIEAVAMLQQSSSASQTPAEPHVEPYRADCDRKSLQALAQHFQRFSPLVGVDTTAEPDSLLLDITGCSHLFGGEYALAGHVVHDLFQRGLFARVATADTVGTAWAVAHAGGWSRESGCAESSVRSDATSRRSPLTLATVVEPGGQRAAIAELSIQALRLPEPLVDSLHELGLYRVEQLLDLPRSSLVSRFGTAITEKLDQALGQIPEVLVPERFVEPVCCGQDLEHPTSDGRVLQSVIGGLVSRMVAELKQRHEGVLSLQCRLQREAGEPLVLQIGLAHPSVSAEHLLTLLQMRLERTSFAGDVSHVSLQVSQSAALEVRQRQLFDTQEYQDDSSQLTTLIDRLSNRLGPDSVVRPELLPDAQPETAVRYYSPVANHASQQSQTHVLRVPPRPILMDPRPVPLPTTHCDETPLVCFRRRGRQYHVARYWGPERIETGWWRGRFVRRDYYRVETTDGRRFWLFQRLDDGHWFLHGAFD